MISSYSQTSQWPRHKQAAVVLTFDDALASQLDIAIPLLDERNLKATFYISGDAATLETRLEEWRRAAATGHELGNHTLFHPCQSRGETRNWLPDRYKMEHYTKADLLKELRIANVLLHAVDGKSERSFAYTCGDSYVGENEHFAADLQDMFPAARDIGDMPTSLDSLNLGQVPSIAAQFMSGDELIAPVKHAEQNGTMAVFLFHGIDEGHLPITESALTQLLDYLAANRDRIWTDTFLNVMQHIRKNRQ